MATRSIQTDVSTRKKLLLCIDDHAEVLEFLREFLEASGYSVMSVHSGNRGLQLMEQHPADAVLVDYDMPRMKGDAVAAQIHKTYPELPIFPGMLPSCPPASITWLTQVRMGEKAAALLEAMSRDI
jgi:CheY-like chemotaxis protein